MNILEEARSLLHSAGYTISSQTAKTLSFEDTSVYGFISVKTSAEQIIGAWEKEQADFMAQHSQSLRDAPDKAWNAYSIFLTEAAASDENKAALITVEEDFRATRKIARADIRTNEDLTHALFPLLPIRNLVVLGSEDAFHRLRESLSFLSEQQITALLGSVDSSQLADLFLRE